MKTIISIGFLFAATFVSLQLQASGGFRVNTLTGTEKKALLEISDNAEKNYTISISDASGDEIYKHEILGEQQNFNRKYDLSNLDYGVYNVKVQTDGESNEQFVTLSENGIEVGNTIKKVDPYFNFTGNKLILSYLNYNGDKMKIDLYDNDGLVWSKKLEDGVILQKAFDLSKLEKGEYKVVLESDKLNYVYDLTR
jgi:hypothetical protein